MIVGEAMSAKTSTYKVLAHVLARLSELGELDEHKVHMHIINPKAISMQSLYGYFDPLSHDWSDGKYIVFIF